MKQFAVVETDNFGGDYPAEVFKGKFKTEKQALERQKFLNRDIHEYSTRYHIVVRLPYKLRPGFEP